MINSSLFQSTKQDWQTPRLLFQCLHQEFHFTIDAAATVGNALLPRYWTSQQNALHQDWSGERVWCNPPYGPSQRAFLSKGSLFQADVAVFLIPARPDTSLWQDLIFRAATEIRFIRGRIQFVGAQHSAPFPSALVIFGDAPSSVPPTVGTYDIGASRSLFGA